MSDDADERLARVKNRLVDAVADQQLHAAGISLRHEVEAILREELSDV